MKTPRLFRRWQRHYAKLFAQQWTLLRETREEGGREQVHELRITLRRLRLMLRVAGSLIDEPATRRYRSWSRGILKGTSRLRDYDAALEWLGPRNAGTSAVRWIERQRHRLWRTARVSMTGPPVKTRSRLSRFKLNHREKIRLENRFWTQLGSLQEKAGGQMPEILALDAEARHEVRRKLRRIRYLLEIALPHRKRTTDRSFPKIIRLQTAMGELQNLANTRMILSRVPAQDVSSSLHTLLSRHETIQQGKVLRYSSALYRPRNDRRSRQPGLSSRESVLRQPMA